MGVRPASRDQPAVPGQQGGGRHTESCPRRARKDSAESGQERAIGGLVGRTPHLAPKNFHFIAQGGVRLPWSPHAERAGGPIRATEASRGRRRPTADLWSGAVASDRR